MINPVKMNNGTGWLRSLALPNISDEEITKLEKASVHLNYKKGEPIIKQGSQTLQIAYLQSGLVKFNFVNELNKNIILSIVAAPKILGGANLFYQSSNLFSIIACEDCSVFMIDNKVVTSLLETNAKFSFSVLRLTSEMYKDSILNFISLVSKNKEGRIADIIIYLAEKVYRSNYLELPFTRKELSEFAGCSPENVIMALSRWKKEKLIKIDGRKLEIIDIKRLKMISKNC